MIRSATGLPKRRVIVTGPGADAVRRAVDQAPDSIDRAVLMGFAHGIDHRVKGGDIYAVDRVMTPDGRQSIVPWVIEQLPRAAMVTMPEMVRTPEEKAALAARTGASLADREGAAFAAEASRRRWKWAIVRAVFDGHDIAYPDGLESIIRPNGTTSLLRSMIWGIRAQRSGPAMQSLLHGALVGAQRLGLVAKFVTTKDDGDRASDADPRSDAARSSRAGQRSSAERRR